MSCALFDFNFLKNAEVVNYKASSNAVSELGETRAQLVVNRTRELGRTLGLTDIAVLQEERNFSVSSALYVDDQDKRVFYNYFFLLEPEDFPEELRLTDENDPRLYDNEYLHQVSELIKTKLGMERSTINEADKSILRIILKLLLDPAKCKLAKDFLREFLLLRSFFKNSKGAVHLS